MTRPPEASALRAALDTTRIWWFLDYDGTLADFAPNPDVVTPDPALIALITRLAAAPDMRVTVISGRRLAHIDRLLPIDGVQRAGTYGLELRAPDGTVAYTLSFEAIRPGLERIKAAWQKVIDGAAGFYLEDKGWSLAIHAKDATSAADAAARLARATSAMEALGPYHGAAQLHLLGGDRFLEVAPPSANKRVAVERLLAAAPWPEATPIYLGDDDKDARAFAAIRDAGGITIGVGPRAAVAEADYRLPAPADVRAWLEGFVT